MNIIYSAIIILIVSSNLFGQSLNDLIVTKNQDSIRCKITLVNDDNIFYQYKKKRNIKTDYISRELVLDFQGSNLDLITVKRKEFKIYNKCVKLLAEKGTSQYYCQKVSLCSNLALA